MKKILNIFCNTDKANEFEWALGRINNTKYQLIVLSLYTTEQTALHQFCDAHNIPFYHIYFKDKKNVPTAILKTYLLIKRLNPNIVHAQLFEAGLIGITSAWMAGIKHRVYTRHYSDYHHKYAPSGAKYDKWINSKSTHIVSITKMVSDILIKKESVSPDKITLIYHGFPFDRFRNISYERIFRLKQKYHIPENKKIIGVISRYTFWKGVQDIIPAFLKIHTEQPNTHLVLANAKGDYAKEIQTLLKELPKESYTQIDFEQDNAALFKCFDIFVHVPIDAESEAFGQIYIESLLTEIPSIFTLSGIALEIIKDNENALVVPYQNPDAIYQAIKRLLIEESLREKLKTNGLKTTEIFDIDNKISSLEQLYDALK